MKSLLFSSTLLKRDSNAGVSCDIYEVSKNKFFSRTPAVTASGYFLLMVQKGPTLCRVKHLLEGVLFLVRFTKSKAKFDEQYTFLQCCNAI